MATSRKNTTAFLTQTPAFLRNNPTVLDQEKENFEKAQIVALTKSLSLEEGASKEKHVRTLIIGTFVAKGPNIFWQKIKDVIPLHGNDVVCWKFLIVLHRLINDGHADVPKVSRGYCGFIDEVVKTHEQTKSSYGRLGFAYGGLIISKLLFHAKYPEITGNLNLPDQWLLKNDAANNFELAVDFLDLLERINQMKIMILNTFDSGKSHSLTHSGQCRLSALIPCINDSAKIFDLLSKTMKILHRSLPWDTLSGHRQRFRSVYNMLGELYEKLNTFQYLRGIVQIPRLSGDISKFISSLHRIEEHPTTREEYVEEVDTAGSEVNDLISVDDSLHTSMAYIQQEYSDLSSKYQAALQMLQEERMYREGLQREMMEREEAFKNETQVLQMNLLEAERCNQENLEKFEASAKAAETALATTNQNSADSDKLEKLKAAYQKLRSDHITLIREKADTEKQLKETIEQKANKNREIFSLINKFLGKHDFLKLKSISNLQEMKESFEDFDDNVTKMTKAVEDKDKAINQIESEMRLLEFNCGEKNLASKEELRVVQKRIPELEEQIKLSESEIGHLKEEFKTQANEKLEWMEKCKKLESKLSQSELIWRSKLVSQLDQLAKRLTVTSRAASSSSSQGAKNNVIPHLKTIFDPNVIPDPKIILRNDNQAALLSSLRQNSENNQNFSQNGASEENEKDSNIKLYRLCTMQDMLFYIMFTIMELQPYANITDNLHIDDLLTSAYQLAELLQNKVEDDLDVEKLEPLWQNFLTQTETKLNSINGITEWDPTDEVDKEIYEMQESINAAAAALEKMMLEAKANEASKPNIDVDLKIIDSVQQLLMSVQAMIKNARLLQKEITQESSSNVVPNEPLFSKEHYQKNEKWSEGLTSAAKDIGGGANVLVEAANDVINNEGKFEELIAASQEIAGSTAQMVIASKVKARSDSEKLQNLKSSSKIVAESTAQVIATCKTINNLKEDNEANEDFSALSVHQSKRLEMEIQIKVLELETQLEKQREKLFSLRKLQYATTNSNENNS